MSGRASGVLAQTLEVLELDGTSYRIIGAFKNEDRLRARPFEAFELELRVLWERG